jgi:biopolymer transport protein ExbD
VKDFIANERSQMSEEDQQHMTVSIRADRDVPMGIIADVKQELQKAFALRINYSATEKVKNLMK